MFPRSRPALFASGNAPSSQRPLLVVLLLGLVSLGAAPAAARTGRLLTMEAAEVLERPVLGLQRTAVPVAWGVAVDTSLYADLLLTPNIGLRYAHAFGSGPIVVAGVRYAHFVGAGILSDLLESQEPAVRRFDAAFSGPTVYGLVGYDLGPIVAQVEGRYSAIGNPYTSVTGGLRMRLPGSGLSLIGEAGLRFASYSTFRAAAGFRHQGEHFGLALGVAYVDLEDPLLPGGSLPVLPTFDVSWSF